MNDSGQSSQFHQVYQLRELGQLIEQGIRALGEDSIGRFEQILWEQEMRLAALNRQVRKGSGPALSSEEVAALQAEARHLEVNVRIYDTLIRQCSQTTAALSDLCALHRDLPSSMRPTHTKALLCEA